MGVVITGKFTINSPVTLDQLKEDWETGDTDEVLLKEGEALASEMSQILNFEGLNEFEAGSAVLKVQVAVAE